MKSSKTRNRHPPITRSYHTDFDMIRGYNVHTNVGIHIRGPAMLTKEQLTLTNINRLLSGNCMVAGYRGVWIVNIYAPYSTAKRQEREDFYNVNLTYPLRSIPPKTIIGGFQLFPVTGRLQGEHEVQRSLRQIYTRLWPQRCGKQAPRAI